MDRLLLEEEREEEARRDVEAINRDLKGSYRVEKRRSENACRAYPRDLEIVVLGDRKKKLSVGQLSQTPTPISSLLSSLYFKMAVMQTPSSNGLSCP